MIRLGAAALCWLTAALLPAFGQIPDSPVRVIVPFTPAGTSDIVARILVNAVAADFPRGIIVENKGGAGGNLGMAEAARRLSFAVCAAMRPKLSGVTSVRTI